MNELNWNEIGGRLKKLRRKNNITIERLCEIIGVSTSFIGLIERGESRVSVDNLYKLSCVFNVSVDFILTGNTSVIEKTYSKFDKLNAALYDYSDDEVDFAIDILKFLKQRTDVKKT